MYRNGAFTDLVWEEVESCHKQQWDAIYNHFGFSGEDAKIVHLIEGKTKLEALAENCVNLCRGLLFSLEPLENLRYRESWHEGNDDFSWHTRNLMESSLTQAICDHLVVSFAYRFFCENLRPEKLKRYSDILFELQNQSLQTSEDEEKIFATARKWDAYKSLSRKYDAFCKEIGVSPQNTMDAGTMMEILDNVCDKDAVKKFKKLLNRELNKDKIPPPQCVVSCVFCV